MLGCVTNGQEGQQVSQDAGRRDQDAPKSGENPEHVSDLRREAGVRRIRGLGADQPHLVSGKKQIGTFCFNPLDPSFAPKP